APAPEAQRSQQDHDRGERDIPRGEQGANHEGHPSWGEICPTPRTGAAWCSDCVAEIRCDDTVPARWRLDDLPVTVSVPPSAVRRCCWTRIRTRARASSTASSSGLAWLRFFPLSAILEPGSPSGTGWGSWSRAGRYRR